jgi:nucleoid-associated protein EbfC
VDIQYLMRQAKKLEKAMADAKEKLGDLAVEAEAGGGLVKVQMNGKCEVTRLVIDAKALEGLAGAARAEAGAGPAIDPAEKAMLEDLVAAAVNAAVERARASAEEHMAKASGGIKIPGVG